MMMMAVQSSLPSSPDSSSGGTKKSTDKSEEPGKTQGRQTQQESLAEQTSSEVVVSSFQSSHSPNSSSNNTSDSNSPSPSFSGLHRDNNCTLVNPSKSNVNKNVSPNIVGSSSDNNRIHRQGFSPQVTHLALDSSSNQVGCSSLFRDDPSHDHFSVNTASLLNSVPASPQLHLHSKDHHDAHDAPSLHSLQSHESVIHPQIHQNHHQQQLQEELLIEKTKRKNQILSSLASSPASGSSSPSFPYQTPCSTSLLPQLHHHPTLQLNLNPPSSSLLPSQYHHNSHHQHHNPLYVHHNNLFAPSSLPFRENRGNNFLFNNFHAGSNHNFSSLNNHRRCGSVASFDHFPTTTKYSCKRSWIMDQHPLHPPDDSNRVSAAAVGYYGPASQTRDWSRDDRWETNTAITANTSLHSGSIDMDLNLAGKNSSSSGSPTGLSKRRLCPEDDFTLRYRMDSGFIVSAFVSLCAFISPIIMIILPRLNSFKWNVSTPGPECDGILISFCCKLLLLVLASWLLFVRKPRASFPGILIYRAVVVGLVFLLLLSYWLFYSIRASERRLADYELPFKDLLLSYPVPLVENLLWVHYLAVILMEIRHARPEYHIKIVRSPDGIARSYTIGSLSIQRTAVWVLEKYYTEFPIYNPHLDVFPSTNKKKVSGKSSEKRINVLSDSMTTSQGTPGNRNLDSDLNGGVKYYDIDGMNLMNHNQRNQQLQQQQHHGYHNINSSTPNSSNTPFFQQNQPNGIVAGNVGIVMPSSPRSTRGLLNQSGGNNNDSMLGGSNSIYSLPRNNHHHQSNHLSSKKSHSVVGVETSSRRGTSSRSSSSHHHRSDRRSGSRDRGREKERDHHHHNHHRDRSREQERDHDRLYEEFEFERKVKKRRARLVSSAEEAFTHIKLVGETDTQGGAISMSPFETAQAIFPSMARPLQKYLKLTRQQQRHTLASILEHLSTAMKYGLSAKAFLEKYLSSTPVLNDDLERNKNEGLGDQSWGLVSDVLLSRSIRDGTTFMLRQGDVSLLVTISSLPFFQLQEEVIDPKNNRFVFRLNSETSV